MNKFGYRKEIISGIIITVCAIYILRLFYYQVIDDTYKIMGDNNSQRTETLYPARGLIYDRNGKLLVDNQAAYDLLIIPDQVKKFDTLELISILDISKEYLEKGIQKLCPLQDFHIDFTDHRRQIRYSPGKAIPLSGFLYPNQNIAEI